VLPCFNPLPPLWGGRTIFGNSAVSIPRFQSAPAFVGRENIDDPKNRVIVMMVSIRSRLCGAGERALAYRAIRGVVFQSAPAFVGRENRRGGFVGSWKKCFNPLPPLWGGRTSGGSNGAQLSACFNPLPPLWGGRTARWQHAELLGTFSVYARNMAADYFRAWVSGFSLK